MPLRCTTQAKSEPKLTLGGTRLSPSEVRLIRDCLKATPVTDDVEMVDECPDCSWPGEEETMMDEEDEAGG